jgi:hypothetical protein
MRKKLHANPRKNLSLLLKRKDPNVRKRSTSLNNQTLQHISIKRKRLISIKPSPVNALAVKAGQDNGSPLADRLKFQWKVRSGSDLSDFRVHPDSISAAVVRQSGANAISFGKHLFFTPGKYDSSSRSGQELLGHEVAHGLQTRADGPATTGSPQPGHLESEANEFGKKLAHTDGPVPASTKNRTQPVLLGDKQINFSGKKITVSDTYVLHGPGVSDEFVKRFQEALDEYYNDPNFTYRGYDVSFRLSVRKEQSVTRTIGLFDWESTDWGTDPDTMLMRVETGGGRAGGISEITVYASSTKGTIAHEVGHYLSDRVGYFSEGYTEGVTSRLGIGEPKTEIRPEL